MTDTYTDITFFSSELSINNRIPVPMYCRLLRNRKFCNRDSGYWLYDQEKPSNRGIPTVHCPDLLQGSRRT